MIINNQIPSGKQQNQFNRLNKQGKAEQQGRGKTESK